MSSLTELPGKVWEALPFSGDPKPLVTHLDFNGPIMPGGRPGKTLSLRRLEKAIDSAFAPRHLKAVAISVNSPGGSPVQSRLIHDRIRALSAEKEVPVLTFVEDVGASGGYILAMAGDEIFADENSIVGSIGVISTNFGFVEAISKLGVERRVYTAGENKSQLDPFRPEEPEQIKHHKMLLDTLHESFIDLVKSRRPGKLADKPEIFSGLYWAASEAKDLGLIDEIGELRSVLKERYGEDVKIKPVSTGERGLLGRFMARTALDTTGLVDPDALIEAAERRSLWARYGL